MRECASAKVRELFLLRVIAALIRLTTRLRAALRHYAVAQPEALRTQRCLLPPSLRSSSYGRQVAGFEGLCFAKKGRKILGEIWNMSTGLCFARYTLSSKLEKRVLQPSTSVLSASCRTCFSSVAGEHVDIVDEVDLMDILNLVSRIPYQSSIIN